MSETTRDAIVVGGGPAGSTLAALLAERGHDVLLLEAARFPRDKVCGDSVSPEGWRLIDAVGGGAAVRELRPWTLRGMRLVSPDGTSFRGDYRGRQRLGLALRRRALDQVLLDCARERGVEVREGWRVRGLVRVGHAVAGVTAESAGCARSFRARIVCGADGRRSVVARRLSLLREDRRLRRFAVRGYWQGMEGLEPYGEMHVGGGGYCGIAPLAREGANVTFVLDAREMAAAAGDLDTFYRRALRRRWPRVAERLERALLLEPPRAIGPLALESQGVVAEGALLLGDAAGFHDPFTGEGVTLALRSAEMAASAIDAALRARPGAALPRLADYERARTLATRDKFRFNRLLQHLVRHASIANAFARRLAARPHLADRLVGVAGDFVPARTALSLPFLLELLRP